MNNLKQTLIALDQLVYCCIGTFLSIFNRNITVYADLTISAQSYRLEQRGLWYGKLLRKGIDMLFRPFGKNHCYESYMSEKSGCHLPDDL